LPPKFFIDRNLGSVALPRALRDAGWDVITMADQYGETPGQAIADVDWLALAGTNGWPVLMKDKKIRYRPAEKAVLLKFTVKAFCLTKGGLTGAEQIQAFRHNQKRIFEACAADGPFLYSVSLQRIEALSLE